MDIRGYFVSDIPRRAFLEKTLKGGVLVAAGPSLLGILEGCASPETASAKVQIDPHLLDTTIRAALANGGEFADVYVENRVARSIVMEESRFKSAEFVARKEIHLRLAFRMVIVETPQSLVRIGRACPDHRVPGQDEVRLGEHGSVGNVDVEQVDLAVTGDGGSIRPDQH